MNEIQIEKIEQLLDEISELRKLYLELRAERDLLLNQGIVLKGECDALRQEIERLRGQRDWVLPPSGEQL